LNKRFIYKEKLIQYKVTLGRRVNIIVNNF